MTPTARDVRLDVLAAWRAVVRGDPAAVTRLLATTPDPAAAFVMSLRLCSTLADRWLGVDNAADMLIDRLVADDMRLEVDRL